MEFLLSPDFSVESQEGQKLIERIQNSYDTENKEEFLKIREEIADMIIEKGIVSTTITDDELIEMEFGEIGEHFNANIFKIMTSLTEMQCIAFVKTLVLLTRGDDLGILNAVIVNSSEIFQRLKMISEKIEKNQIEEGLAIKQDRAFFNTEK